MPSERPADPARGPKTTIFVSDPSAEAEQISGSLRSNGYQVVDVPLGMMVARVAVQRPRIVVVDADADGAYAAVLRMRELPDAESIDVLFLGRSSEHANEAIEDAGSYFARPVDVKALLRRIQTLTSEDVVAQPSVVPRQSIPPSVGALPPASMRVDRKSAPPPTMPRVSQPPPSAASFSRRAGAALSNELMDLLAEAEERALAQGQHDSTAPTPEDEIEAVLPSDLLAALDEPLEEPEEEDEVEPGRQTTSGGNRKVTTGAASRPDIEINPNATDENPVLAQRRESPTVPPPKMRESGPPPSVARRDSSPPTTATPAIFATTMSTGEGGHSIMDATRPADPPRRGGFDRVERTDRFDRVPESGPHTEPPERARTNSGPSMSPTGVASFAPRPTHPPSTANTSAGVLSSGAVSSGAVSSGAVSSGAIGSTGNQTPPTGPVSLRADTDTGAAASVPAPVIAHGQQRHTLMAGAVSVAPPIGAEAPIGPGDALITVARAVATRVSGSLSFEAGGTLRRIVLREGDLITCASSLEPESLLAFLQGRGDLPRERAEGLAGRVPAFGRHAGAALVAHGILRQDQLWPVLRAHAEWILGRVMTMENGLFVREAEAPGRLKGEPSVFGGSTGAEIVVDVARRVVPVDQAIARLGGPTAVLAMGPNDALLVECALDEREVHIVRSSIGRRIDHIVAEYGSDAAPLLHALAAMGVVEGIRSVQPAQRAAASAPDPLDEEAILAKVEARLALVDEGDYFAILGVPRSATGYEIRRAFLDLRRAFEPARLLTPNLTHLVPDVTKIATVLEEAFDILRDDARRERYRRAIEAAPYGD